MSILIQVATGPRATAGASMHHIGYKSLIRELSMSAVVSIFGVAAIEDGDYDARYEGRGLRRDAYLVAGQWILKLHPFAVNRNYNAAEANALKTISSRGASSLVKLRYQGVATVRTPHKEFSVDALLCDYGGDTIDKILERSTKEELTPHTADFLVSLYKECGSMCFDGLQSGLFFADLHTANLSTWSTPCKHFMGHSVYPRIIDAESCGVGLWKRCDFNKTMDEMLQDVAFQCLLSSLHSWKTFGQVWSGHTERLFRQNGNSAIACMKQKFHEAMTSIHKAWICIDVERYAVSESVGPAIQKSYKIFSSSPQGVSLTHCFVQSSTEALAICDSARASDSNQSGGASGSIGDSSSVQESRLVTLASDRVVALPASVGLKRGASDLDSNPERYAGASLQPSGLRPIDTRIVREETRVVVVDWQSAAVSDSTDMVPVVEGGQGEIDIPQHQSHLDTLSIVGLQEKERQRTSAFRGQGRFQQPWARRISWHDRVASANFQHEPIMTREQSDDVGLLLHMVYVALKDKLDQCPLNLKGRPQRRVARESEFVKHGMHKRVYQSISWFAAMQGEWFSADAALFTLIEEFKLLEGSVDQKLRIRGFRFEDEFEMHARARQIVVSYMAVGGRAL